MGAGGGLGDIFKFISNVLIEEKVKMGVSIFFIEYGLMIEKICFFGVGSQNFPLKNSPFIFFFWGGVQIGLAENGLGQYPAAKGCQICKLDSLHHMYYNDCCHIM